MATSRRRTIAITLALLSLAIVVLALLLSSSLAQQEEVPADQIDADNTAPPPPQQEEVIDEDAATSSVVVLTADNFESSIASGGKWFVKFFAPWCPHCKSLVPEWEKTARLLNSEKFHVAKIDCTVSDQLCTQFQIQGFPTLKFIEGDVVIDYEGPRNAEAFVSFAKRLDLPPLTPLTSTQQLDDFLAAHEHTKDKTTAFVFFGSADCPEKSILESAVQPFRASLDFAHAITPDLAAKATELGAPSLPALISRTPDATFVFDGASWNVDALKSWISTHRFGLLPELSPQNFFEMTKISKPIVLMALLPTKQPDLTSSMQQIGREVSRLYFDSFTFTWIDGEKWIQYIEGTYNVSQAQMPHAIVLDPPKNAYYNTKLQSQEKFATFLDSITSGVLKPTFFKPNEDQEHSELSQFEQYKMLAEDYITEYLWYTLLGCFFGGLFCGWLFFGGRSKSGQNNNNNKSSKQANGKQQSTPTKQKTQKQE